MYTHDVALGLLDVHLDGLQLLGQALVLAHLQVMDLVVEFDQLVADLRLPVGRLLHHVLFRKRQHSARTHMRKVRW